MTVVLPEPRIGSMPHRSVHRPWRRSSNASSASASSFPAATSASISRSQVAASKSANHVRNASSSSGDRFVIASSIALTVLTILAYALARGSTIHLLLLPPPVSWLTHHVAETPYWNKIGAERLFMSKKEWIATELDRIPDHILDEVLDFVRFLCN